MRSASGPDALIGAVQRPLLLVVRPIEEAARTAQAAEAAGFRTLALPLMQIEPLDWQMPEDRPDSLLFTSARAPGLSGAAPRQLPAYAVGVRTAEAAAAAGFHVAAVGDRGGTAALARVAADGHRHVLHLGGADTAPIDVPDGIRLERRLVYAARSVAALPSPAVELLTRQAVFAVLLFSARSARLFASLLADVGIERASVALVALSPTVAAAAGAGWRRVGVCARPTLGEMVAATCALRQDLLHA